VGCRQQSEEAIAIANDTRYGLNATVFTRDIECAFRLVDRLHCGDVNMDSHFTPDTNGGKGEPRKMSRLSPAGAEAYTALKDVHLRVCANSWSPLVGLGAGSSAWVVPAADHFNCTLAWQPQRDSNPCLHLERVDGPTAPTSENVD